MGLCPPILPWPLSSLIFTSKDAIATPLLVELSAKYDKFHWEESK
jgi:hypothetical protein